MSSTSTVHTILGANGVIGRELSRLLPAQGIRVRQVGRSPRAVNDGDDVVAADLLDAACHRRRRRRKRGGVPAGRPEVRHEGLAGAVADRHAQRHRRLQAPRHGPRLLRQRLRLRPRGRPHDGRDPVQPVQPQGRGPRAHRHHVHGGGAARGTARDDRSRGRLLRPRRDAEPRRRRPWSTACGQGSRRSGSATQTRCTRSPTRLTPAARWRNSAPRRPRTDRCGTR